MIQHTANQTNQSSNMSNYQRIMDLHTKNAQNTRTAFSKNNRSAQNLHKMTDQEEHVSVDNLSKLKGNKFTIEDIIKSEI